MKIAVGASSFGRPETLALLKDYELALNPYGRKLTEAETIEHLHGAVGLLAGLEPLTEAVLAACPGLKAIARIGMGMDNIDLPAAKRYGLKVSNTPESPAYAVAEMTLAALLSIARRIPLANADLHGGIWKKRMGFSLKNATVLLVGYGRIGRAFERLLEAFSATVLKYDPLWPAAEPLSALLPLADIVSLHASGTDRIIGAAELAAMKPGSVLLNSARGGLVDEAAVYKALTNGQLSWYWADAFSEEPYPGPLRELENALLTPHIATYTELCRQEMEALAVKNLLADLRDA